MSIYQNRVRERTIHGADVYHAQRPTAMELRSGCCRCPRTIAPPMQVLLLLGSCVVVGKGRRWIIPVGSNGGGRQGVEPGRKAVDTTTTGALVSTMLHTALPLPHISLQNQPALDTRSRQSLSPLLVTVRRVGEGQPREISPRHICSFAVWHFIERRYHYHFKASDNSNILFISKFIAWVEKHRVDYTDYKCPASSDLPSIS